MLRENSYPSDVTLLAAIERLRETSRDFLASDEIEDAELKQRVRRVQNEEVFMLKFGSISL